MHRYMTITFCNYAKSRIMCNVTDMSRIKYPIMGQTEEFLPEKKKLRINNGYKGALSNYYATFAWHDSCKITLSNTRTK